MNEQERVNLLSIIESLMFVSENPITINTIKEIVEIKEKQIIKDLIDELINKYKNDPASGIEIVAIASGYQFRTKDLNAQWIKKLNPDIKYKLSQAAMDTLAIISYKQPITKAEVEDIRGVDSGGVIRLLLEKKIIRIIGKKKEPGRPIIYGTTKFFLELLGLNSLSDLPPIGELAIEKNYD